MALSGSAARRYAEALFSLATDERTVEGLRPPAPVKETQMVKEFRVSLERIANAFDRRTIAGLRDPAVPIRRRRDALAAALKDEHAAVRSLLLLLLDRDRIALVPKIAAAFANLVDEREGIAKARITTAVALSDPEREGLISRLESTSRKKLRATFAVDPELIGGAKVQIGDHLIDASLRARLAALHRQLAS
ncbi:MAG TPA: ATP synthase F1 subunit delta [Candidatus Limnocylindria bacterium]|jgi:F-type H+-transporting ATPase subunit delta|nr:ATP synthase F1 subunit delta [Candidatus Limnocylindria bacterium]